MERKKIIYLLCLIGLLILALVAKHFWQPASKQNQPAKQANVANKSSKTAQQEASAKVSTLMFDKAPEDVHTNSSFSIDAIIDPKGKKISASELHVTFDPKMIKLNNISASNSFSLVLDEAKIDNDKGTASIVVGIPLGKSSVDVTTIIASFNFQTLDVKGKTEISFTEKSGAAADGETTNVVAQRVSAEIIVQ